jgi:hypothetical protein
MFEKGKAKTGGRQPGTPNRLTGAFREAVRVVYDGLGGHRAFLRWATKNQTEFYRIASRLIPTEIPRADSVVNVVVQRGGIQPPGPVTIEAKAEPAELEDGTP